MRNIGTPGLYRQSRKRMQREAIAGAAIWAIVGLLAGIQIGAIMSEMGFWG